MSSLLTKFQLNNAARKSSYLLAVCSRNGHTLRGKPPGIAKTLEQRLAEENVQDPELTARVNIGLPRLKSSRSKQMKERLEHLKAHRANPELEKAARNQTLRIDFELAEKKYRESVKGQLDLRVITDHYGIYEHLFGLAYFVPRVSLDIKYRYDDEHDLPVYNGNYIKPAEAKERPHVQFNGDIEPITGEKAECEQFWTLLATNPDGNLKNSNAEFLHWFVTNIPDGKFSEGDEIVEYLPPFPPRGFGYQRFVFVLYKQNGKLDFNEYKLEKERTTKTIDLEKRTFFTEQFYRKHQDNITPAGIAFYQTDWDETLTQFYHKTLKIKEPICEYDAPAPYFAEQKLFPLKRAFNLYMDNHRDKKKINLEFLERKLAKTHPFDGPEPPLRFPNAHPIKNKPSWLITEIKKQRLGIGRINDY